MIGIILGLGIVAFLILFLASILDKEHFFLKYFLVVFVFLLLFLIPKVVIDNDQYCEIVINESEEVFKYGDNYTGYHWDYDSAPKPNSDFSVFHINTYNTYERVCFTTTNTTGSSFFKIVSWLWKIFIAYISVYIFYYWIVKKGGEK